MLETQKNYFSNIFFSDIEIGDMGSIHPTFQH